MGEQHAFTIKEAVAASPQVPAWWTALGVAQYRGGDSEPAVRALEKSIELAKGGACNECFFLAMAHWQLGHRDQARQWYRKAVDEMGKTEIRGAETLPFHAEAEALIMPGVDLPADVFAP